MNDYKKRLISLLMAICLALLSGTPVFAEDSAPTPQRNIRVGWYLVNGLQNMDGEGNPSGYDYEYLKAISQYTGWEYTFVPGTWEECLSRLESGEIDLMGGVYYDKDYEGKMAFSEIPAGAGGSRLICARTDSRISYEDYAAMDGKTVGALAGSPQIKALRDYSAAHGFSVTISEAKDQQQLLGLLNNYSIDLALVTQSWRIDGFRSVLDFNPTPFSFAVSKKRTDLLSELNSAMAQIRSANTTFDADLRKKYFGNASGMMAPSFTREEKDYIAAHPTLTVAYDPAWQPIEYLDSATGEMKGIMRDVFRQVTQATRLQFQFVTSDSFAHSQEQFRGGADIFSSLYFDYDWGEELGYRLTQPLFDMQVMQVYSNSPGKIVALPEGYFMTKAVKARYADAGYEFHLYPTVQECMEAVYTGKADMTFLNSFEQSYFYTISRYATLHFQPVLGFSLKLCMAVSSDRDQLLFSIINKAVSSIPDDEMSQILAENTIVRPESSLKDLIYTNPVQVLVLSLVFVLMFVCAAYMLARSSAARSRSRELSALNAELVKANAAKSEFLSRMSHDIRTPMNAIIGMTRMAQSDKNPPDTADCLKKIDVSSQYMLGLLNDILDMTKIESGEVKLYPQPYPPEEFVHYLGSVIQPLCDARRQQFLVTGAPERRYVPLLDKLRVNQVMFNLLSNAVKYTQPGGIIECHIEEQVTNNKMELFITVRDNGQGMSKEFQEVLFDPFSQEDRIHEADSSQSGTGLGLSIVKKVVDLMNGTIEVQSHVNEGSTFLLHLTVDCIPAGDYHEEILKSADHPEKQLLQGKKLLLCEDNKLNQEIAITLLRQAGLEPELAENGKAGYELFLAHSAGYYTFIITDIRMPEMDGYQFAQAVRASQHPDAQNIPIIAMTADAFEEDIRRCMDAGMNAHIAKPLDPQRVFTVLLDQYNLSHAAEANE